MKHYDKLVRDNIPSLIKKDGKIPTSNFLSDKAYSRYLDQKFEGELHEFFVEHNPKCLADVLEVVDAEAKLYGSSYEAVSKLKDERKKTDGGFDKRIRLLSVSEPEPIEEKK